MTRNDGNEAYPHGTEREPRHSDPYCVTHCVPGIKVSQCGCDCDHRALPFEKSEVPCTGCGGDWFTCGCERGATDATA